MNEPALQLHEVDRVEVTIVMDEVLNGGAPQPRDDIALLVLRVADLPPRPQAEITRLLPNEARAAALARDAIHELEPILGPRLSATARLMVSEIVTNSVRHAGAAARDAIELRATVFPDRLRVEVSDQGAGFRRSFEIEREPGNLKPGFPESRPLRRHPET